jgi:hypothetical protein
VAGEREDVRENESWSEGLYFCVATEP